DGHRAARRHRRDPVIRIRRGTHEARAASAARSELRGGACGMNQRHETSDMDPKYIAYFAAALVVVGILVHIALCWMLHQFEDQQGRRQNRPRLVGAPRPPPQPTLKQD